MKGLCASILILFLSGYKTHGQNATDSATWDAASSWLERKMTFNYYDPTNQHWWVNLFHVNYNGTYTIKNVAAKHPNTVSGKVYHNRTFNLYDINPNSLSIIDLPTGQGRFVKGKIIRAEGFKDEKKISVKKDDRVGSNVGFIHISVPQFLLDSTEVYAEELQKGFAESAFLNARLFNSNNFEDNITTAFKSLRGSYISEDSTSNIDFEVVDVGLVRMTIRKENKLLLGTIGFDVQRGSIFLFIAGNKHYSVREFSFDEESTDLKLISEEEFLHVIGRNTLNFGLNEIQGTFYRY